MALVGIDTGMGWAEEKVREGQMGESKGVYFSWFLLYNLASTLHARFHISCSLCENFKMHALPNSWSTSSRRGPMQPMENIPGSQGRKCAVSYWNIASMRKHPVGACGTGLVHLDHESCWLLSEVSTMIKLPANLKRRILGLPWKKTCILVAFRKKRPSINSL